MTVTLDLGKLFPGKRPPEVMEKARAMMDQLDAAVEAAALAASSHSERKP